MRRRPRPAHYHPRQEERFEVLSGSLMVLVDGGERRLGAGEVLTIPAGTPHGMWTGGNPAWISLDGISFRAAG